jgi:hypothetical protein
MAKEIFESKPESRKETGRPSLRLLDDNENDL